MRRQSYMLHSNQVYRAAAEHLQTLLQFEDFRLDTLVQVLWSLLLVAARIISRHF